jgi:hypothetical protein
MDLKINRKGALNPAPLGLTPPVLPGKEFGRISGPLLSDNLLRSNQNLAFDTDAMYLNVNSNFVGFNTDKPTRTLTINGKSFTTDLIVDTQADLAHLTFKTNKIQNSYNENIIIQPNQTVAPTIYTNGLGTTNYLTLIHNELYSEVDTDIVLDPTGLTNINSNTYVDGYVHATGNITFDGNITFGNEASDTIGFGAEIATNILPNLDGAYNLGGTLHLRVPNDPGFNTTTSLNYFYATKESWEVSSGQVGYTINDVKFSPGTTVSSIDGPLNDLGYDFYVIYTSTNQLVDISQNDKVNIDLKNWLSVYSTNFNTTSITSTNANIATLTAGNVRFNNHTISNISNDTNLNLVTSGVGTLRFNDFFNINQTGLISHTDNAVLSFYNNVPDNISRVTGYVKFSGSNGVVIPAGNTLQRPTSPEIGTTRYNSTLNYVEVYANVSNTSTITLVFTSADAFIGDNIIYTTATAGFSIGDFIISPSAFPAGTIVLGIVTNVSITFSNALTANLLSGSTVTVQRKWIPIIGTSPVLSQQEVTDTMDLWTLILG